MRGGFQMITGGGGLAVDNPIKISIFNTIKKPTGLGVWLPGRISIYFPVNNYILAINSSICLGAVYKGRPPKSRIFKPPPSPCPGVSEFPKPPPSPDVRVRIFQFLHIFQFYTFLFLLIKTKFIAQFLFLLSLKC